MTGEGIVVWFTGLPASGKSTLARRVHERLGPRPSVILDSDELRDVLGATAFDEAARAEQYRALVALARLLAKQGLVVLVAATGPRRTHRELGSDVRGLEVWVRTPLEVCEARDPKGLYAAARRGMAPTLPGVGAVYEPPEAPAIVADGGEDREAVDAILALLDAPRT